ncbi:hypothetical protein [Microbacterium sp.]|uniref:hypothetical protein n=1 Tax=Microbacterium sp. TaxID=51671 RepID=UPI0039E25941
MPTARHRYQVTETDEVARALDAAERRWPGEPRSRLLVRLITENGQRIAELNAEETARKQAAIRALAGSFSGMYPPGYLEELRAEWPE